MNMEKVDVEPLVRIRNLKVGFRLDRTHLFEAVKGISFDIPKNATVALVGESGSGKSVTSLAILACCRPRTRSSIQRARSCSTDATSSGCRQPSSATSAARRSR
jgi:ABC-type dipeptide/oligopeptide/nickel transport system ATPase component